MSRGFSISSSRSIGSGKITVEDRYDAAAKTYDLTLSQATPPTPGQKEKQALVVPIAMGLIGADGKEQATRLEGESKATPGTRVLVLSEARRSFRFIDVPNKPTPSLLRRFSAPVKLKNIPLERQQFLALNDTDPFARWEAGQQVATHLLLGMVAAFSHGDKLAVDAALTDQMRRTLAAADRDPGVRRIGRLVAPAYLAKSIGMSGF